MNIYQIKIDEWGWDSYSEFIIAANTLDEVRRIAMLTNSTTMTSREIADYTGKQHSHLMRDIREMEPAWEKVNQSKFGLVEYTDAKGEKRPMYPLFYSLNHKNMFFKHTNIFKKTLSFICF